MGTKLSWRNTIVPKPNRLVGFDANISHRATTFRKDHRFTIAIKFYG